MKVNFTPIKLYSTNNTNNFMDKVFFGEINKENRVTQSNWDNDNIFAANEDDYDIFQYSELADNETKFRNLPKNHAKDRANEIEYLEYLSEDEDPLEDDFLDRLTY